MEKELKVALEPGTDGAVSALPSPTGPGPGPGLKSRGKRGQKVRHEAYPRAVREAARAEAAARGAKVPEGLLECNERWREHGLQQRQVVFELHCRQGRSLTEVGEMLGITRVAVGYHWRQVQKRLAEEAPRTPEQMVMLREEIAARLRATIDETHLRKEAVLEDGQVTTVAAPPTPQLLAIRLRALEQMARLYDLNLEQPPAVAMPEGGPLPSPSPYVTPAALAEEVRVRRLELYRRGGAVGAGVAEGVGGAEIGGEAGF